MRFVPVVVEDQWQQEVDLRLVVAAQLERRVCEVVCEPRAD